MPSLNVANYIEEAVQSAKKQTLHEIELICIDAGSDDGTWEILSRLAKTDDRIILRHSDKKSYGYQVNLGISIAKGEYIAVLETDDYVDSGMYEKLYQKAVLYDCDYVKSDYFSYRTQEDGSRFFIEKRNLLSDYLYGMIIEPKRYWEIATEDWYLWSGIYKKKFLNECNIRLSETPGAAFQDIGFLYQVNVKAKKALYLKERYYRYCMDREGASSNTGKGLQYSYDEYSYLCKQFEDDEESDLDTTRSLYCRMAKSFICCCNEIAYRNDYLLDKEKMQHYQWFQTRLENAINGGIINKQVICTGIWEKIEGILKREYKNKGLIRTREEYIKSVIGEPGKYPLVIFGCGFYGYKAYQWLKNEGYEIKAFMDNNKALWGTTISGILVESPEQTKNLQNNTKYLIANEQHAGEIKKQLLNMGILDQNIEIYI